MQAPKDNPIITTMVAALFVLGVLYQGWITQIRDWIHGKVAEQ